MIVLFAQQQYIAFPMAETHYLHVFVWYVWTDFKLSSWNVKELDIYNKYRETGFHVSLSPYIICPELNGVDFGCKVRKFRQ